MNFPTQEAVKRVKDEFPKGTRVKLVRMQDPNAPAPGSLGTVQVVDDIGTIHVKWDCGSSLGVVLGEDSCVSV